MIKTTLCYIKSGGKYLMLNRNKKANDLNEGKWIGIGGKFKPGESADECLAREVREETGLEITEYCFHGIIRFRSELEDEDMYLYSARVPEDAQAGECDEGTLAWIDEAEVLDLPAWEGDRLFLEKLLAGEDSINMTLIYENGKLIDAQVL